MNKDSISNVLVKATREMLKEYRSVKFFSNYENNERRINANIVVSIFDGILRDIRDSHPNGDKMYLVLYQSFFQPKYYKRTQLCDMIGNELMGRYITVSTLYRWQQEGIKIFAYALWTNPQFMDISINIFSSPDLKRDYDEICAEHKRLKNG